MIFILCTLRFCFEPATSLVYAKNYFEKAIAAAQDLKIFRLRLGMARSELKYATFIIWSSTSLIMTLLRQTWYNSKCHYMLIARFSCFAFSKGFSSGIFAGVSFLGSFVGESFCAIPAEVSALDGLSGKKPPFEALICLYRGLTMLIVRSIRVFLWIGHCNKTLTIATSTMTWLIDRRKGKIYTHWHKCRVYGCVCLFFSLSQNWDANNSQRFAINHPQIFFTLKRRKTRQKIFRH